MALVAIGVLGGALFSFHDVVAKNDAVDEKTVAVEQLGQVADPLAQLCAEDPGIRARVGSACGAAQAAVDSPTVQAARDGSNGAPGRGITGTTIGADGHLVVAYDDGTTRDVGKVVGDDSPVETGPVFGSDGTSYSRSITCVDPSSASGG